MSVAIKERPITKAPETPEIPDLIVIPGYCPKCGWKGNLAEANHGYRQVYYGVDDIDIEPVDYCPVCGTETELL